MAIASPVLERNTDTQEREYINGLRDPFMTAEERHNSRISANYAKLINPESKTADIIVKEPQVRFTEENIANVQEERVIKPYLVENARADAEIFRADSPINRKLFGTAETIATTSGYEIQNEVHTEEDENEDLRPTLTTIQYKTEGVKKDIIDEGKIEVKPAVTKKSVLTRKDKIVIAVALSVIVALFVLIIVNSVVISNLSADLSNLKSTLSYVESTYEESLAAKNAYLAPENLSQVVNDFATDNGMILK